MGAVVDQAGDIFLRHLGQLLLEDILEPGKDDGAVFGSVIIDYAEFDLAFALFEDCGL